MSRLRPSILLLGLTLGIFALGPAMAYEYGWIVARSGPRANEALSTPASRSATVGVWMNIASASGVRTGAGAGPWLNLVSQSLRKPQPSASPALKGGEKSAPVARPVAPPAASPPASAAGAGAKGSTQSRP